MWRVFIEGILVIAGAHVLLRVPLTDPWKTILACAIIITSAGAFYRLLTAWFTRKAPNTLRAPEAPPAPAWPAYVRLPIQYPGSERIVALPLSAVSEKHPHRYKKVETVYGIANICWTCGYEEHRMPLDGCPAHDVHGRLIVGSRAYYTLYPTVK